MTLSNMNRRYSCNKQTACQDVGKELVEIIQISGISNKAISQLAGINDTTVADIINKTQKDIKFSCHKHIFEGLIHAINSLQTVKEEAENRKDKYAAILPKYKQMKKEFGIQKEDLKKCKQRLNTPSSNMPKTYLDEFSDDYTNIRTDTEQFPMDASYQHIWFCLLFKKQNGLGMQGHKNTYSGRQNLLSTLNKIKTEGVINDIQVMGVWNGEWNTHLFKFDTQDLIKKLKQDVIKQLKIN